MTKEEKILKHLSKNPSIEINTDLKLLILNGFSFNPHKEATMKRIAYLVNECGYICKSVYFRFNKAKL